MKVLTNFWKGLSNRQKDCLFGVGITSPAIILLILLFVYPILYSFAVSFTNFNYVRGTMKFVGLKNYISAFSDGDFLNALQVTLMISVISVVIQLVFGILLSLLVMNTSKGQGFYKTAFLIPMMIAPTVAGLLWRFLLNNEFGLINVILQAFNLKAVPWLVDSTLAKYCVILADSWASIPFMFLLMYTAMTGIPQDMLEAGRIDGGNAWQILFRIQLPSIRSALMVSLVLRFMDVFRIYDSIYIMTKGGPGTATESLSLYIYRVNWNKYMMGKASAFSYIMMIIMTIVGLSIQYFSDDRYDRQMKRSLRRGGRKAGGRA